MIDIAAFFVDSCDQSEVEKSTLVNTKVFYNAKELLSSNSEHNIDIKHVSINDIPQRVDSDLVIFLDDSLYVKDNFVNLAIHYSKIFDDYGLLCGPTSIAKEANSLMRVYEYDLNFYGSKVTDITGEVNNYPPIVGSIISGEAYNKIAYTPAESKRHKSFDNYNFLEMLSKRFKIYHTDGLAKHKKLNKKDAKLEMLSKKYYDDGYQAGSVLFNQRSENKVMELWHRFVQSPESFDYNCPRWMMREVTNDSAKILEDLIVLRCQYQIGFYEGMTNKILI